MKCFSCEYRDMIYITGLCKFCDDIANAECKEEFEVANQKEIGDRLGKKGLKQLYRKESRKFYKKLTGWLMLLVMFFIITSLGFLGGIILGKCIVILSTAISHSSQSH